MLRSLWHCPWQILFFLSVACEQQAQPDQKTQCWLVPCPLHAQQHNGQCGGILLHSKAACKRCFVDWVRKWMIMVNESLLLPSVMAEPCWLCMAVGYTNTPISHFHFCLSHSKQQYRMRGVFFTANISFSLKSAGYSKAMWQLERSVGFLQKDLFISKSESAVLQVSTVVIWSVRASSLKVS